MSERIRTTCRVRSPEGIVLPPGTEGTVLCRECTNASRVELTGEDGKPVIMTVLDTEMIPDPK